MNLLTNCPNCGAPLSSDGYCSYCNTKVRYANEIESNMLINNGGIIEMEPSEILFKFKGDDNTTILLPFYGKVSNIEFTCDSTNMCDMSGYVIKHVVISRNVKLELEGNLCNPMDIPRPGKLPTVITR